MNHFQGEADYQHGSRPLMGVLLVNLGTPDAPDTPSVRRYLHEFLSDPRVIEMRRWVWKLILHGVILRIRPARSARLYQKVWTDLGSPLLVHTRRQALALQEALNERLPGPVKVVHAMRYGNPAVAAGLAELRDAGARRLLVLPMYPQYSATTTASAFDAIADELKTWRWLPELRMINQYHDDHKYIRSLAASIRDHWQQKGPPDKLLMSFHGIPKRYLLAGDPYHCHCHKTARLLANELGISGDKWQLAFQSRVGREEWLKPYTDKTLKQWGKEKLGCVDVVCPGFPADCLETIEEIDAENRETFQKAGGGDYRYIPALNDRPDHIDMLAGLVERHASGWPETDKDWNEETARAAAEGSRIMAMDLGAER